MYVRHFTFLQQRLYLFTTFAHDCMLCNEFCDAHPPAAAACRHVLPRLSAVSISKPADRTESLHIMLNLRPDGGSAGRRGEARHRERDREEDKRGERQVLVRQVEGGNVRHDAGHEETQKRCTCCRKEKHPSEQEASFRITTFSVSNLNKWMEAMNPMAAGWIKSVITLCIIFTADLFQPAAHKQLWPGAALQQHVAPVHINNRPVLSYHLKHKWSHYQRQQGSFSLQN